VSNKYQYALHGDVRLSEKVLRVFASNDENAQGVFKLKTEERIEKIANTPEKCFINNEDVKTAVIPEVLDKGYYIEIAQKRLNDFLGIPNKRKSKKKAKEDTKIK
jgi:hypothetical protein